MSQTFRLVDRLIKENEKLKKVLDKEKKTRKVMNKKEVTYQKSIGERRNILNIFQTFVY
jgi:hypothetical protein